MIKINNLIASAFLACIIAFIPFSEVVADCDSINHELTSKFRFLGGWDRNGTPDNLEAVPDTITDELIDYVNATLPESVKAPDNLEQYFKPGIKFNTEFTEQSKVYLTMVYEGAVWKNTLGFYTYDVNNPPQTVYDIDSLVVIFPNVSQPDALEPGDKVYLGDFPADIGIGYFLIARGWSSMDSICIFSHIVFTDPHLNTFTTPEFQQHTILLNCPQDEKFLLCFEDVSRPAGDNDFNDAVFYITAETGSIDTTNIPVVPTAQLSGREIFCSSDDAVKLDLVLSGKAPWTVTLTNGVQEQTIKDIQDENYTVETTLQDSIWIKAFSDDNMQGLKSGFALVDLYQSPKATLDESLLICSDDDSKNGFIIQFEGVAPFSLTYKLDENEITIDELMQNQYPLTAEVGSKIQLIAMADKFCNGSVNDPIISVRNIDNPELLVEGTGAICEGETDASLNLQLDGEGPWTVDYLYNNQEYSIEVESEEYKLDLNDVGLLEFKSLSDANCEVPLSNSINIVEKSSPLATISNYSSECGDEVATVDVALEGEGPWILDYLMNGVSQSFESEEASLSINIAENGTFELIKIQDSFCGSMLEASLEIALNQIPSAIISGDAVVCNEEEVTVKIALTGFAPFSLVYSDGENEISVDTEESTYEFLTGEHATYTLVSFTDAYCEGIVEGSATISDGSEEFNVEIEADETSCFGDDILLALIGETDGLTVSWSTDGAGTFSNEDQLSTTYTPGDNESGETWFYAEVSNGCAIMTESKSVNIIEELTASFDISPDKDHLTNTQITFTPNENGYEEYLWEFGDDTESSATVATTEYTVGGIYIVNLTVKVGSCEASSDSEIEVLSKDELFIPNAFHPYAQNPENQVVKVYGNNIDDFDFYFKIVNRWGKVMYETNSFNEANSVGWNGINNNTGEELETNVFTYIVRGKFIEGDSFEKTGTITQLK